MVNKPLIRPNFWGGYVRGGGLVDYPSVVFPGKKTVEPSHGALKSQWTKKNRSTFSMGRKTTEV